MTVWLQCPGVHVSSCSRELPFTFSVTACSRDNSTMCPPGHATFLPRVSLNTRHLDHVSQRTREFTVLFGMFHVKHRLVSQRTRDTSAMCPAAHATALPVSGRSRDTAARVKTDTPGTPVQCPWHDARQRPLSVLTHVPPDPSPSGPNHANIWHGAWPHTRLEPGPHPPRHLRTERSVNKNRPAYGDGLTRRN